MPFDENEKSPHQKSKALMNQRDWSLDPIIPTLSLRKYLEESLVNQIRAIKIGDDFRFGVV